MNPIDPRLNDIDDCLYRVAIRVLIVQDDKVLLVKESDDAWWALPGGGVDHGETIESTLVREVEEELGVPAKEVSSDFEIVYYNIGNVVNSVPRMNLFFKASVPKELLGKTDHAASIPSDITSNDFGLIQIPEGFDKPFSQMSKKEMQHFAEHVWQPAIFEEFGKWTTSL